MENIKNLESKKVFEFFEEINKIPRPSFHEEKICEYIEKFAKDRNLEVKKDSHYNVVVKKKATKGYEKAPVVALQGHTDMVCEKNKGTNHDFYKDPIKMIYDGDILRADNTTLGADNGIGVCMALAILDSDDIEHPAIEAIFTTSEETGMEGADALDTSNLNCDIFLNLDSDEEGIFTVGCAGGAKADIEIPLSYESIEKPLKTMCFGVYGLSGGHSGINITDGLANSNKLLARAISILMKDFDIAISKIDGGAKDNAIPREAEAVISIDEKDIDNFKVKIKEIEAIYKKEYKTTDKNLALKIEDIDSARECFTKECKDTIINTIMVLPNGVQTMSKDIKGLPESSLNVGVIKTIDDKLELTISIRSSLESKKSYIIDIIDTYTKSIGAKSIFRGDYPAWEYKESSIIREKCIQIYKEMYNKKPEVKATHAGLECGLFSKKMPNIDIVSFGANLYDIHTPEERASISSIDRVWKYLKKLLTNIK